MDPTPRGGGLIVAAVSLLVYVIGSFLFEYDVSWGFLTGALLIVIVSWADDLYSVPFIYRLIVHSLAAAVLIFSNGYISTFSPFGSVQIMDIGWFGAILTFCWIVWLVNAYNFMDGIDGIAGIQAVSAGLGWLMVGLNGDLPVVTVLGGTIVFVSFAFLLHNWPPARIFMGDAGSAFLGFVFAGLPLLAKAGTTDNRGNLLIAAILFVWLFVFDSVFTFIRRAGRLEKVWQAHREHLYQRLVLSGYSHRTTTTLYGSASIVIAVATVNWLSNRSINSLLIVGTTTLVMSLLIVIFCWRRKCLFGSTSQL